MQVSAEKAHRFPSLDGFTILVVEDDEDTMELLRAVLGACGARTLLASSAVHARGYLQTNHPDLIVSDLAMPHEDGPSFVRWLRAHPDPAIAYLPVVAVTAFYEDYPPARARLRGVLPQAGADRRARSQPGGPARSAAAPLGPLKNTNAAGEPTACVTTDEI